MVAHNRQRPKKAVNFAKQKHHQRIYGIKRYITACCCDVLLFCCFAAFFGAHFTKNEGGEKMGSMDISNYEKSRQDAENFYRHIGKLFCPAFKELVYFTSEGFNHLVYRGNRDERDKGMQMLKFSLLGNAKKLVETTTTFQEYEEGIKEFVVKRFKRKEKASQVVKYWGLIAIMGTWKIKVVVRQIGDGQKHFWSVIPNWTTNKYRDMKMISRMKGNPEED